MTAESASSNGNFKLGFSAIGETGRESYGFVLAVDSEGTEGSVTLNGKRENGEGLTKGSLELTVVGFDGNENADGSAVGSFDIAAVTDSGTVIGFSYSRATVGATTSSDYVIRFGVSMGIGSLTLSIPAHAETVRGENGSLTHTFTVNTSAAGIKKELVDVDISLTFAVGATPSDVELTFPTVTEDKVISLTDPDDADAVKAYLENAEREYREIVELIRGLIGNADTDTDAGADAEK